MYADLVQNGPHFMGATSVPGLQYLSASRPTLRATYHPSRKRSPMATAVIKTFCAAVSSVMVTRIDRGELFEKYDLKLWSYEDQLTLFTIATVPSVIALAAIYVGFRGIQGFRLAFAL